MHSMNWHTNIHRLEQSERKRAKQKSTTSRETKRRAESLFGRKPFPTYSLVKQISKCMVFDQQNQIHSNQLNTIFDFCLWWVLVRFRFACVCDLIQMIHHVRTDRDPILTGNTIKLVENNVFNVNTLIGRNSAIMRCYLELVCLISEVSNWFGICLSRKRTTFNNRTKCWIAMTFR